MSILSNGDGDDPRPPIGRASHNRWRTLFVSALSAVALSVIVLIAAAIAASCGGGSAAAPTAGIEYQTATPTDTATATATQTETPSPTDSPTRAPSPTAKPTAPANNTGGGPTDGNSGGESQGGSRDTGGGSTDTGGSDSTTDNTPLVTCGDLLAPLDKQHRLSADCAPSDLIELPSDISAEGAQYMRAVAATALEQMFAAAASAGYQLVANSTYRSYQTQVETFNYWVSVDGLAYAERTSARPGHSEHQLGTVADVGTASGHYLEDFTGTPEAAWLDANCYKYGFIVSYPPGTESITGYVSEPWHVRYVGVSTAAQVRASGKTLHQFLLGQ